MTATACPRAVSTLCSSRWGPDDRTAAASVWRWPRKSRANTADNCATAADPAPPYSACCCPLETRVAEPATIWIVDDDRSVRFVLAAALSEAGFAIREFSDAESALAALADNAPPVLFSDVRMAGANGLHLLERIGAQAPGVRVIMMSAFTDVATSAAAYRHGAFDYLPKPFDLDDAVAIARRALAQTSVAIVAAPLPAAAEADLIGHSPGMRELFRVIGRVAASGLGVLITGETGTGKELVARALHRESARATSSL